ncbi:MAG: cytidylate kinase-like family protein [Oscillospiraceae bacterium]|nr:cytidylate kinase-like family protein [Oscillospiraceae bacterium]
MIPVITISREFGSGGHTIGQMVAEKLKIPFYDSLILEKAAEKSGFAQDVISEQGEYTSEFHMMFNNLSLASAGVCEDPQDKIFRIQQEIILECAKAGPCVIVGRCADYILEKAGVPTLNVFIHADLAHRKEHVLARYGQTDVSIDKRLARKDRSRKVYFKYYTDRNWGDYHNYDLSLNAGQLGEPFCAEVIVAAVEKKGKQ